MLYSCVPKGSLRSLYLCGRATLSMSWVTIGCRAVSLIFSCRESKVAILIPQISLISSLSVQRHIYTPGAIFTKPLHLCDHANLFFDYIHPIVHWLPDKRFAWSQGFEAPDSLFLMLHIYIIKVFDYLPQAYSQKCECICRGFDVRISAYSHLVQVNDSVTSGSI
jgi:hypothetical protein